MVGSQTGSGERREGDGGRCSEPGRGGGVTNVVSPDDDRFHLQRPVPVWAQNPGRDGTGGALHASVSRFLVSCRSHSHAGAFFARPRPAPPLDMLVGAGLGLFSPCGQTSLGLALSEGIPGNVVLPVARAG